ncbi:hypothetical protein BDD12DRAFT_174446 [Trichophaea hybrida]|nr:hypothetical protein BDD12DRAFT_174446 [Trichophaea hybrida]
MVNSQDIPRNVIRELRKRRSWATTIMIISPGTIPPPPMPTPPTHSKNFSPPLSPTPASSTFQSLNHSIFQYFFQSASNFSSQQLLSYLREFHEPSASARISALYRDPFAPAVQKNRDINELKEHGGYYDECPRCPKKRKWEEEENDPYAPDGVQEIHSILDFPWMSIPSSLLLRLRTLLSPSSCSMRSL